MPSDTSMEEMFYKSCPQHAPFNYTLKWHTFVIKADLGLSIHFCIIVTVSTNIGREIKYFLCRKRGRHKIK